MINYLRLLRHMALSAGEGKTEGKSRPDELCERRMNYGMFFRPLKHASIKTDVCRQVFVVEATSITVVFA